MTCPLCGHAYDATGLAICDKCQAEMDKLTDRQLLEWVVMTLADMQNRMINGRE